MDEYLTTKEACSVAKVSPQTLRRWAHDGTVRYFFTKGGQRRYHHADLQQYPIPSTRRKICYARVSTRGQLDDLERQQQSLRDRFPSYECLSDIGSGLNFERRTFSSILEAAFRGDIEEFVITHKDRLCRFGYSIIEKLLHHTNGKIVVLYPEVHTRDEELVEDVISILTSYSARIYGRRSHQTKKNHEKVPRTCTNNSTNSEHDQSEGDIGHQTKTKNDEISTLPNRVSKEIISSNGTTMGMVL